MRYIFITNNPELANYTFLNGASRIMVDLEIIGKKERQKGMNSVISDHQLEDILKIKSINKEIPLICRINPVYTNTEYEINQAINFGADYIMLPMFTSCKEINYVYQTIKKRAKLILLFETPLSIVRVQQIVNEKNFDEAHIGLNDLSLAMGVNFMFEMLTSGIVEYVINYFKSNNIPFGIGGIAKHGEGIASSELVMSEHVRLGSTSVILSRSFHEYSKSVEELTKKINFSLEINNLNNCRNRLLKLSKIELDKNKLNLAKEIYNYLNNK
jgi:hypothetical protein